MVQEDIARRIADKLQGTANTNVAGHRPVDPAAYKSYLQARVFWNKRTQSGLEQAVKLFQEAIARKPDYAEAYAGLAATYHIMPEYSPFALPREFMPLARAAAQRALELDPTCAEAHAVLGNLQAAPPARDFKGAELHFRQAMELDPNYATAHQWYGRFLLFHGDRNKALTEFQTAVDLDPLSPAIRATISNWYYFCGDYDRAITESRNVMAAFPDFPPVRFALILSYLVKRDYEQALKEIDRARALQPDNPLFLLDIQGYAIARAGRSQDAQQILKTLEAQVQQGKPLEAAVGVVYVGLRDYDRALDYFEKLIARDGLPEEYECDPLFAEVRALPRAQALAKRAAADEKSL
jgi:serine/threonine-protein kinase